MPLSIVAKEVAHKPVQAPTAGLGARLQDLAPLTATMKMIGTNMPRILAVGHTLTKHHCHHYTASIIPRPDPIMSQALPQNIQEKALLMHGSRTFASKIKKHLMGVKRFLRLHHCTNQRFLAHPIKPRLHLGVLSGHWRTTSSSFLSLERRKGNRMPLSHHQAKNSLTKSSSALEKQSKHSNPILHHPSRLPHPSFWSKLLTCVTLQLSMLTDEWGTWKTSSKN